MDLNKKIQQIKYDCLKLCVNDGAGFVTSAFSCAEEVCLLYYEIMNISPEKLNQHHDHFIMSKNHASVITYPILADLGFINKEDIQTFLQNGSIYGAHSKLEIPGTDFAGGALGIGIGVACGMSFIGKQEKNKDLYFCIIGDGECYEGSIWEAAMFAGHYKLNNLILILDRNHMTVTDFTDKMLNQDSLKAKFEAFNFETREVKDGHNLEELRNALFDVRSRKSDKPLCIIANTIKGHGVSFMENNVFMHGVAPSGQKAEIALKEIKGN